MTTMTPPIFHGETPKTVRGSSMKSSSNNNHTQLRDLGGKLETIFALFLSGATPTQRDVSNITTRLAAYVHLLKERHDVPIDKEMVTTPGGSKVAKYFVPREYLMQFRPTSAQEDKRVNKEFSIRFLAEGEKPHTVRGGKAFILNLLLEGEQLTEKNTKEWTADLDSDIAFLRKRGVPIKAKSVRLKSGGKKRRYYIPESLIGSVDVINMEIA